MDAERYIPLTTSQGGPSKMNNLVHILNQPGSSGPSTETTAVHTPVSSSGNTLSRHASRSDSPPTNHQLGQKPWDANGFRFPVSETRITVPLRGHNDAPVVQHAATKPRYAAGVGHRDIMNAPSSPEGYRQHHLSSSKDSWASNDASASTLSHSRISSVDSNYHTSTASKMQYHSPKDLGVAGAATGPPQQYAHEGDGNRNVRGDRDSAQHSASRTTLTGAYEPSWPGMREEGPRSMGGCLQPGPSDYSTQYATQELPRAGDVIPKVSNSPGYSERRLPPIADHTLWPESNWRSGNQESILRTEKNEGNDHQANQQTHTARASDASLSSLPSVPSPLRAQEAGGEDHQQGVDGEDGPPPPFDPNEVPTAAICMWVQDCNTQSALRKIISHVFGRNKLCTRQIPEPVWVHMCRKHYQRVRYRHTDRFAKIQVDLVLKQLDRLEAWSRQNQLRGLSAGILQSWTLGVRKREQKRVDGADKDTQELPFNRKRAREEDGTPGEDSACEEGGSAPPLRPWPTQQNGGDHKTGPTVAWQPPRKKGATAPNAVPKWLRDKCGTGYSTEDIRQIVRQLQVKANAGEIEQIPDIELLPTISVDQDEEANRQKYRRRNQSADLGVYHYGQPFDGIGGFGGPGLPMSAHNLYSRPNSYGGPYTSNGYPYGGYATASGPRGGDMYSHSQSQFMTTPQSFQPPVNSYGLNSLPARTPGAPYSGNSDVSNGLWHPGMSNAGSRTTSETYHFGEGTQRSAPFSFQGLPALVNRPLSQSRAYSGSSFDNSNNWNTPGPSSSHTRSQSDLLPYAHSSDLPHRSVEATAERTPTHYNHGSSRHESGHEEEWPRNQVPETSHGAGSQPETQRQTSNSVSFDSDQSRLHRENQLPPIRTSVRATRNSAQADSSDQHYAPNGSETQYSAPAARNLGQAGNSGQPYAPYSNGTRNLEQGHNSNQHQAPYGNGT